MSTPRDHLASGTARTTAYLFDVVAASTAYLFLVGLSEAAGSKLDMPLLYAGCLFLYSAAALARTRSTTPGKYLLNIAVIDASGRPLTLAQLLLRSLLFALPFALIEGAPVEAGARPDLLHAAWPLLGALYLLVEVMIVERTHQRRTIADRLCRTLVVKLPPLQPHRAPAVPMYSANDAEFGQRPAAPPPDRHHH